MKRIYFTIFFLIIMVYSFNIELYENKIINIKANYNNLNVGENADYNFIGVIKNEIKTSQYNGNGTNIPYTFYNVEVIENVKGKTDKNIIIKFYGGYKDNILYIFDNMQLPEINECYYFMCNRSNLSYYDDYRTIEGSYVISSPDNLKKIDNVDLLYNKNQDKSSLLRAMPGFDEISPIEPGGDSLNTSYSSAIDLTLNIERSLYFNVNVSLFYKINRSVLDYLSVYTSGTEDIEIFIYDELYNVIYYNDYILYGEHGYDMIYGNNSLINFYCDKGKTYYFEVKLKDNTKTGSCCLHIIKDNYIQSNFSDLVLNGNSVDEDSKKVDYIIESKYVEEILYGIQEWEKLGSIDFQEDTILTLNNVLFTDHCDYDVNAPYGYTSPSIIGETVVSFNTAYFDYVDNPYQRKTILHEIGHVLGLGEFTHIESTDNVMHQGYYATTKLGPADIAAYRYLWN